MFKKSIIGLLAIGVIVGATAWFKRVDIMLGLIKFKSAREYVIAPHRDIPWQQGPEVPVSGDGERPPNIIVILADDLGINDISTFGGGVAGGRVQTAHIDQLAAQGAVFNQAYAGAASCAPSRARIMQRWAISNPIACECMRRWCAPWIAVSVELWRRLKKKAWLKILS